MILSGTRLQEEIEKKNIVIIDPFNPKQVGPHSYNLRLHSELAVYEDEVLEGARSNTRRRRGLFRC